tara:strand:+ start:1589 stop:2068 length:480 start_codon:yes stop_codon:yes gene_type:complete
MSIKVKVTSSIDKQVTEAVRLYNSNAQRHLDRVANHLRNQSVKGIKSTPKVGRQYKRGKKIHTASVSPNPPAIDSGRLVNSIFVMRAMPFQTDDRHSATVFTNVNYALSAELGARYKKRPFLGKESMAYKNTEIYANKIASDISIKTQLPKPIGTGKKI